jgi:FkbH-like protein
MTKNISFLDASKIIKEAKFSESRSLKLLSSFNLVQLEIYLKAYSAINNVDLNLESIPFGTLNQHIIVNNEDNQKSILILTPSDFSPSLDWRTGFPERTLLINEIINEIEFFKNLVKKRNFFKIFFLQTTIPPLFENNHSQSKIELYIRQAANDLNASMLEDKYFCLDSYLASGCAIGGADLSSFANHISASFFQVKEETKKMIITDLDNTLWNGILGEDGINSIKASSEGRGFHHFIYQTFLKKLKESGTLLSICSKNDKDLVIKAFKKNNFILDLDDFVSIQASYNPKSLQIKELAKALNLGLESFVFIDDNPVEISEVHNALPEVTCILFSSNKEKFVDIFNKLSSLFPNSNPTEEDRNRTKFYRSMKKSVEVIEGKSSDLSSFLQSLEMKVLFSNKTINNHERAIQLINKTNQFNLNGIRRNIEEVNEIIRKGGFLFTASLSDINGEHGEIISLLIDRDNEVKSFVMSCRVFQRKIEFLFLSVLLDTYFKEIKLNYIETDRNSPMKMFLENIYDDDLSKVIHITKPGLDKINKNLDKIFSKENIIISQ